MRLERISRPVVDDELAQWIGKVAQTKLQGQIKPNRFLGVRLFTSGELRMLRGLSREDVDGLQAWLAVHRAERPVIEDVPLLNAHPRRPDMLVMDLGGQALVQERQRVLAGIGEILWANITESRDPRLGLIMGQIINTAPSDYQRIVRVVNEAMYDAPASVSLGGLQMDFRTDDIIEQ